jgi:7-carboxy-7-deazaguanine synthase
MTTLPVNEIFDTIQGEANYTGMPSTFVRLQGCDVGCPWCDTKHTWKRSAEDRVELSAMLGKGAEATAQWSAVDVDSLVDLCKQRHVVLTGGEPADHDLKELTTKLIGRGKSVQIETSGTSEIRVAYWTWITLSPKIDMPGGRKVRLDALEAADEIKMPVGKQADLDTLKRLIDLRAPLTQKPAIIWLQPLSQSLKATALCVEASLRHGYRISVQTHKYLGLR